MTTTSPAAPPRVDVAVHRTVRVAGVDDKPAVELVATQTDAGTTVQITPMPRNSGKRQPVKLDDLAAAVAALKG